MTVILDQPVWIAAAALVAIVAALGYLALRALPTSRRVTAVLARVLMGLAIALALAGTQLVRETERLSVVAVLDVSGSVTSFAPNPSGISARLAQVLRDPSDARTDDDRAAVLAFDGGAQVLEPLTTDPRVPDGVSPVEAHATDIARAITRAQSMIPADSLGRVVLISDGVETRSGLAALTPEYPIDVLPIEYAVTDEVVLESVRTPTNVSPGALVPVEITLRAAAPARGRLAVEINGRPVDLDPDTDSDTRPLALDPGVQTLTVSVPIADGRVHRVAATWEPETDQSGAPIADTSTRNNTSSSISLARGKGRVLVSAPSVGALSAASALTTLIEQQGWGTDTSLASELPTSAIGLERYDLVVLVNTPFDAVPMGADAALDQYARELAGGLLFVSGPESLGAGAWQSSEHASMFPVRLDVPDDVVRSNTAVVLVLDSSGSMRRSVLGSSRSQQQIANESAAGAMDVLDPTDEVGVISFSESPRLVVPLSRHDDLDAVKRRVRSISPGGGTDLGPALSMAQEQLAASEALTKHVVVLSDGASRNSEGLPGIAQELGDQGIKVSTITIGDSADEQTMRLIATESGGVYYRVVNPSVLPRVFLKAVRVLRKPMVREGVIEPIIVDESTPMIPRGLDLPNLRGLVLTEFLTDDPRVMVPVVSAQGEPVLAGHQLELGRVSVFTSDVSDWAHDWVGTSTFDAFFRGVLAWTARSADPGIGELRVDTDATDAALTYTLIDDTGAPIDGADVTASVLGPSGSTREITLDQTGPGLYESRAQRLAPGDHIVLVTPTIDGEPKRPSIGATHINPTLEYATLASDRATLEDLAQRSGGRVLDASRLNADTLFSRDGIRPRRSYEPIWRALLYAALAFFLLDLIARRVAWDRWISEAAADTIAVTRRVAPSRPARVYQAPKQTQPLGPVDDATQPEQLTPDPDEESSLLAAKRRARERFERDLDDDQTN